MKSFTFFLIAIFCGISSFLFSQKLVEVENRKGDPVNGFFVSVYGQNTHFLSGLNRSFKFKKDTTIIQTSIYSASDTKVVLNDLGSVPLEGFYDLEIFDSIDGYLYKKNALFIETYNIAQIDVSPKYFKSDTLVDVNIKGFKTHFSSGTGTSVYFIQDTIVIPVNSFKNLTDSSFTVSLAIPANASGFYDMVLNNLVDGNKYLSNAFFIENIDKPSIIDISPDSLFNMDWPREIIVTGNNTHFTQGSEVRVTQHNIFYFLDTAIILDDIHIKLHFFMTQPCKGIELFPSIISIMNDTDGFMQYPLNIYMQFGGFIENSTFNNIKVFPNPCTDIFRISSEDFSSEKEINLCIYSPLGLKIKEIKIQNQSDFTIDLSQYPSGMYFLHIFNEEKFGYVKVLKN